MKIVINWLFGQQLEINMKKYIILLASLALLWSCGPNNKLAKRSTTKRTYNHEAMSHIIDGAIEDLLGQSKNALVSYHQAAEIDTVSPGIYLAIAENYFLLEEIGSSVRMAKKVLNLSPENLEALELLAACYEKQHKFREAMLTYEQYVKLDPTNLEAMYHLTSLQVLNRENEKAFASYQKMVQNGLEDPDYRLRIGNLLFQSRAVAHASSVYAEVNQDFPNYEPGYLALAAVAKSKKDTVAAIDWYRKALLQNARFEDAKAELKNLLENGKKWDQAIGVYTSLVKQDSTNLTDKLQLGQYYFFRGDTVAASDWLKQTIRQHPKSERTYLALGSLYRIQKDTLLEETLYTQTLAQEPGFLDVRQRLRELYVSQKKWDQAIDLYTTLKENDSTYVGSRVVITNLLMQKGDTLQALEMCEALYKDHGDDWRVPFTLARIHLIRSQPKKAAPYFDKAIALREDLPGLWILRGVNFLRMDSVQQAADNYAKAVQLFPEEPEVLYYMGLICTRQHRNNEAISWLEKSYRLEPNNLQTMLALSAAYDEVRDAQRAEQIYAKLLKQYPNLPVVLNNFAYHLAVRNIRLPEALDMALRAIKEEPQNAAYLDTAGWIYFQMGEYEKALELIEKSFNTRNASAEVAEHLGDVYEKLGNAEKALHYWKKSVDMDANRLEVKDKIKKATQ